MCFWTLLVNKKFVSDRPLLSLTAEMSLKTTYHFFTYLHYIFKVNNAWSILDKEKNFLANIFSIFWAAFSLRWLFCQKKLLIKMSLLLFFWIFKKNQNYSTPICTIYMFVCMYIESRYSREMLLFCRCWGAVGIKNYDDTTIQQAGKCRQHTWKSREWVKLNLAKLGDFDHLAMCLF